MIHGQARPGTLNWMQRNVWKESICPRKQQFIALISLSFIVPPLVFSARAAVQLVLLVRTPPPHPHIIILVASRFIKVIRVTDWDFYWPRRHF